jgi:predicted Zn-dependent peptidase
MGIVYKARDLETGEVLAVKILKSDIAGDTQILDRFKNELRLARQITHRNVARLYEFHRSGDAVHLTMEYVEGESLRSLLSRTGPLPVESALELARQFASGLAEAHRQSIVHRDLKPENVMIGPNDELKIMDFGISRTFAKDVTATGGIVGTPAYMAPEQAEGRPVDHRTDIYAFGLVLYEMFTGAAAFTGDTAVTLALKQIRERPKPPRTVQTSVPKHIEAAILRCLEKDPAARFQSIEDAMRALDGAPVTARPSRIAKWKWLAAAALVLVIAAAAWWWQRRPSDSVRFPLETLTLANGLKVALSPDHAVPTFALAVGYRAGTRVEQPGAGALAHLLEHLMFQGSANVGRGEHMSLVAGAGGNAIGQTLPDIALFWDSLPANQLELALFLESDRMRGLEITPEGLRSAKDALAEERSLVFAGPFARARSRISELSFDAFANQRSRFPKPELWTAATVEEVSLFYRANYTPSNAGLVLVGDFEPAKARELIHKYFDSIPARPPAPLPELREPGRSAEKREVSTDPGLQTPLVLASWRVPAATDPDWFVVKRLGEALGANDAARLHTALIKNAGVASSVLVNLEDTAGPNLLSVQVVVAPGKDPSQVESILHQEIDRIAREGLGREELDSLAADALRRRAFLLVSRASTAALMAQFLTAYDRLESINRWESEESRVSGDIVRQMAAKYFAPSNRTVLIVNPPAGGAH